MGRIWEKIPNKCIQIGHASKVDQIKGQSITESLFMNEHKNFDHVFIYKHFEHLIYKHFLVFFIFANKLSIMFLCFPPNLSRFFDSSSRFLVRESTFFLEDSRNSWATCIPSKSFLSRAHFFSKSHGLAVKKAPSCSVHSPTFLLFSSSLLPMIEPFWE